MDFVKREDFMQLKVLLWKQLIVRKSRWFISIFEAVLPLVLYVLVVLYRYEIASIAITSRRTEIPDPPLRRIIYSPHTPMTWELMREVGKILNMDEIEVYDIDHTSVGYWTAPKMYIEEFVKKMKNDEAILVFNNAEDISNESGRRNLELSPDDELDPNMKTSSFATSVNLTTLELKNIFNSYEDNVLKNKEKIYKIQFPEKLNYTIRMKKPFFRKFDSDFEDDTNKNYGAIYRNFMTLQWAVDQAYLTKRDGHDILKNITLREMTQASKEKCTDPEKLRAKYFITICNLLSPIVPYMLIAMRLLEERISGIQELMKMVGVSSNKLALANFLNSVPFALLYAGVVCFLFRAFTNPVLAHTERFLIFLVQLQHYIAFVGFASVVSFIPRSKNFSTTIFVVSYALAIALFLVVAVQNFPRYIKVLTGMILPFTALNWFYMEVTYKETHCSGIDFRFLMTRYLKMSSGAAILILFLHIIYLFFLAWYLDKVRKRPYGISEPWNFLCTKDYWTKHEQEFHIEQYTKETYNEKYFEAPPKNLEPALQLVNLSKVYKNTKGDMVSALTNINLTIYKGEITVLVGHNGAGKTSLMSIITGMTKATEGKVYVFGMDTTQNASVVRQNLSLCTQENLSFPDLTVKEHILLFAKLKGATPREAEYTARDLLSTLNFTENAHSKSVELSGGMKRRLQLACALAGAANILVLDEPTSGLDLESRREIWDTLLRLRGQQTVLMTTHFMEEADALGDRLAALYKGQLRSYATPMFIKQALGSGYRLSLTIKKGSPVSKITSIIETAIPDSYLSDQSATIITYRLPSKKRKEFGTMFDALEENRRDLGIETIGIGITTLDEVFLKLYSDTSLDDLQDFAPSHKLEKHTGKKYLLNVTKILILRQIKATQSDYKSILCFQIVIPILLICALIPSNSSSPNPKEYLLGSRRMGMHMFNDSIPRKVYLQVDEQSARRNMPVYDDFSNIEYIHTDHVNTDVLRTEKLNRNKNVLLAIDATNDVPQLYYTVEEEHVAPIALNLLSNIYAQRRKPMLRGMPITTYNYPIKENKVILTKSAEMTSTWVVVVIILYLASATAEIVLPCKERIHGSRHHHIMSGCPTILYWTVTWLYDLIIPFFILIPAIIIMILLFEKDHTTNSSDFIFVMIIILMMGVMAYLCMSYLIGLFVSVINAQLVLGLLLFMFVIMVAPVTFELRFYESLTAWITHIFSHIFTPYTVSIALFRALESARFNSYCELNRHLCPEMPKIHDYFNVELCCDMESSPRPYKYFGFDNNDFSVSIDLIIIFVQMITYTALLLLAEFGILKRTWHQMCNANYWPPHKRFRNEMVAHEAEFCKKNFDSPPAHIDVIAKDVHKRHWKILHQPTFAVRGVNLAIKKGECFGLLGCNGSGKSSTFAMLAAVNPLTRGQLYGGGYYLHKNRTKYLYTFSYCPQFYGVDPFLSGGDNLRLVLTMRGLQEKDVESEVKAWLECVGLLHYKDRPVYTYSGGCTRRLAAVVALSSDASVSLLDEPTTGVDSAARRRVWLATKRALAHSRAIVITSHSMDEMAAMCHRIAIMNEGEICTLGSPTELRERHAVGYTLIIKLKHVDERADFAATESTESLTAMKYKLHQQFENLELKKSRKTMLHYQISDTQSYSDLFKFLEQLKESHYDIIEDYSVTETTLEEVFLSFGKRSQTKNEMAMKKIVELEKQKSILKPKKK